VFDIPLSLEFQLFVFEPEPDQLFVLLPPIPEPELLLLLLSELEPLLPLLFMPPEVDEPLPLFMPPELDEPLPMLPELPEPVAEPLPPVEPPPMPPAPPVCAHAHVDKLQRIVRTAILVFIFFYLVFCNCDSFEQCQCHG
jgi:hypothetical protein